VRGGAIPLLAWATILLVLYAGNWIWEGRPIQIGTTVFAIVVIYGGAGILWLFRREALKRGPPPPAQEIESVPEASIGSVLVALASASILFGLVWAQFFVYFGAGLLVLALGRVAIELRDERRTRERMVAKR
jgi:hypothetical protein